jgi:ribosomal protein S18 acetylase RimI-like enzyme
MHPTMETLTIISLRTVQRKTFHDVERFHNSHFTRSLRTAGWLSEFSADISRFPRGFIAFSGNRPVGFVIGRTVLDDTSNFNLVSLLVHPDFRGKGLAGTLMKKFLSSARRLKSVKKITLHFREGNELEKLYAKYGFSLIDSDGSYSDGENRILMEMPL